MAVQDKDLRVLNQHIEPKELELSPESAREYDVDNHFKRSLSYVVGFDGLDFHLIRTNVRGEIVTATTGSTVTRYEVHNVRIPAGSGGTWTMFWDTPCVALEIYYKKGSALFRFAFAPSGILGDSFELPTGWWSFDYPVIGVEVIENGGSSDVEMQILVFS